MLCPECYQPMPNVARGDTCTPVYRCLRCNPVTIEKEEKMSQLTQIRQRLEKAEKINRGTASRISELEDEVARLKRKAQRPGEYRGSRYGLPWSTGESTGLQLDFENWIEEKAVELERSPGSIRMHLSTTGHFC